MAAAASSPVDSELEEIVELLLTENDRLQTKLRKRDNTIRFLRAQLMESEARLERMTAAMKAGDGTGATTPAAIGSTSPSRQQTAIAPRPDLSKTPQLPAPLPAQTSQQRGAVIPTPAPPPPLPGALTSTQVKQQQQQQQQQQQSRTGTFSNRGGSILAANKTSAAAASRLAQQPNAQRDPRIRWSIAERELAAPANDKEAVDMIESMFVFDELTDLESALDDLERRPSSGAVSTSSTRSSLVERTRAQLANQPQDDDEDDEDDGGASQTALTGASANDKSNANADDDDDGDDDAYDFGALRRSSTAASGEPPIRRSHSVADNLASAMADMVAAADADTLENLETTMQLKPPAAQAHSGRATPRMSRGPEGRLSVVDPLPTSLRDRVMSIVVDVDHSDGEDDQPLRRHKPVRSPARTSKVASLSLEARVIEDMRDAMGNDLEETGDRSSKMSVVSSKRSSVDLLLHNDAVPFWLAYLWCTPHPRENATTTPHPLVEVCSVENYAIVNGLARIATMQDIDELARQLMRAFEGSGMALELLEFMIRFEVAETKTATTLFRSNSLTSKLLSVYSRMIGKTFLMSTLGPIMQQLKTMGNIEVDPNKSSENETALTANLNKLTNATKQVLDALFSTVNACPLPLRRLSATIKQEVEAKFAGFGSAGISGFLFLRFICAALVAPEAFGFVREPPPPAERRVYILVCKVLQNLANGVRFGAKERFMLPVNAFLEQYEPKLNRYFDEMASVDRSAPWLTVVTPRAMIEESVMRLGSLIELLLDKLAAEIDAIALKEKVSHSLLDTLNAVLREFPLDAAVANDFALLSRFEEVLIMENALLLRQLLANCALSKDLDSVCKSAIHVLSPRDKAVGFILDVIRDEIKQTDSVNKFCESQSVGFRLIAAYISTMATNYLKKALREVVMEVCANEATFETTPQGSRVAVRNMDALVLASYKFFGAIVNSLSYCPLALRQLCSELFECVQKHFSSKKGAAQVLAQVLFLRFFCPAIASPQAFQLVDKAPTEKAHRALVVISYSLKHLAAGTNFKDPQMADLNAFLRDHTDLVQEFVVKISVSMPTAAEIEHKGGASAMDGSLNIPSDVRARGLLAVRAVLTHEMLERVRPALSASVKKQVVKYKLVDRLVIVLTDRYHR